MNKLPFAIGILSWKGYDSLENSLFSYKNSNVPTPSYPISFIDFLQSSEIFSLFSFVRTELGLSSISF